MALIMAGPSTPSIKKHFYCFFEEAIDLSVFLFFHIKKELKLNSSKFVIINIEFHNFILSLLFFLSCI